MAVTSSLHQDVVQAGLDVGFLCSVFGVLPHIDGIASAAELFG